MKLSALFVTCINQELYAVVCQYDAGGSHHYPVKRNQATAPQYLRSVDLSECDYKDADADALLKGDDNQRPQTGPFTLMDINKIVT